MVVALAMLLAPASAGAASAPAWHGVWQGTIGTLPVRACLQQRGSGFANGSYFYLSRLRPIPLSREADGQWTEEVDGAGPSTGRWTVRSAQADRLVGTWRGGGKALPIALRAVPLTEADESPCGSGAFIAPRLRPVRITPQPANHTGFAYTELTYDVGPSFPDVSISSFAYPANRAGDAAINTALRIDPASPEGPADYAGCMKQALGSLGRDGDFHIRYAPDLVTPEFLSVAVSSGGFCGGAHPFDGTWHLLFDRVSGERIDLSRWFTSLGFSAGQTEDAASVRRITPELRALALDRFPFGRGEDAQCRAVVSEADYWNLSLQHRGISFTPSLPRVVQACADAALVPFAELAPFLSGEGRQGAARLARSR